MSIKQKEKLENSKKSKLIGFSLTALFHIAILALFFNTGFKVTYPPPAETGIEVDFELDPPKPIEVKSGHQPRVEIPNITEDVRLVQRSESNLIADGQNRGIESTMGEQGDLEQFEPPREIKIDKRALFPSEQNADSIAPQVAKKSTETIRAGHASGNTKTGSTDGEPQAKLAGRSVMGSLPAPEYNVNKSGKVVVRISVDQYGNVLNATPGISGTTVQDKTLWESSRKAALKAKFNLSSSAPSVQEGTITYVFKLK
jgi:hypothetical protein